MARVKGVAFLIECPGCTEGKLCLGKIEIDCIKCNGYGMFIQKASKEEMLKYLEKQKVLTSTGNS